LPNEFIVSTCLAGTIAFWILLTSVLGTLFKHTKFSNYSFKKSTIIISNAIITQLLIKNLPFKVLKEYPRKRSLTFPLIFFYHNLYVIDILYIPDVSFNRISVPKLTQTISCHLIFYNTKCLIHDNYTRIMIVEAIMNYEWYIMDTPTIRTLYTPIVSHYINTINNNN